MIKASLKTMMLFTALALIAPMNTALAKGSSVRFQAGVVSVEQTSDTEAIVTVRLQSFEVPVIVNADTEIEQDGDQVRLELLTAGSFIKIAGFFSADGIVAEEIDILDFLDGQFRLRGPITAVGPTTGGTLITLLGVNVLVNDETRMHRRETDIALHREELAVGLIANVAGLFEDDQLVAKRLITGTRASAAIFVEFDGIVTRISGNVLGVDTRGGGEAVVILTDRTRIHGEPEIGDFVEIRGTLNAELSVVALSIKVDRDGDGDADDDHDDNDGIERTRRGSQFDRLTDFPLRGGVETDFIDTPGGQAIQSVEVLVREAEPNQVLRLQVTFASGATVDFGTVQANPFGRVRARFRTIAGSNAEDLAGLLPPGETAADVIRVDVTDSEGTALLSAGF